ncbi:MAG: DNA-directed RNA polymerase subunit omega [Bacillota bacterium]|jgi:DNA-directed RNA polymerase omega subunit|nr:DNA-directed RNA polymerase subunit omega [Candidatus Fermentithermobacillaceae bacterium]
MMTEADISRSALSSKYALVIAVAKRAREIVDRKDEPSSPGEKPVIRALDEIMQGKVIVTLAKRDRVSLETQEAPDWTGDESPGESGPLV